MFAYCVNNPVCFADYSGHDAVVLYDEDIVGHIGVLVQDEDGKWWHFYWGALGLLGKIASVFGINVFAERWFVEYTGDPTSLKEINESGQYDAYEEMHYMEGDFSSTIELFQSMTKLYNLYENNCVEVSLKTLSTADTTYKEMLDISSNLILPALANEYIRNSIGNYHPNNSIFPQQCAKL